MIFGIRRVASALALSLAFCGVFGTLARADLFHNSFEREVAAMDTNTGEPIMAPPVPYGHYAKDPLGPVAKTGGILHAKMSGLLHHKTGDGNGFGHGNGNGLFGHGAGCKNCGEGNGMGGHGFGLGNGLGHGGAAACDGCGGSGLFAGKGCGMCGGSGLFSGLHHKSKGIAAPAGVAATGPLGSSQAPSPQAIPSAHVAPSAQGVGPCTEPGCGLFKGHSKKCGFCGGSSIFNGNKCGGCGGLGFLNHGKGCGTPGCGDGNCDGGKHGFGGLGNGCSACGGKGCGLCSAIGNKVAHTKNSIRSILHLNGGNKVQYFVGPGGPVPITPGYVPYINVTRSPRDFFAFPPFTQ